MNFSVKSGKIFKIIRFAKMKLTVTECTVKSIFKDHHMYQQ